MTPDHDLDEIPYASIDDVPKCWAARASDITAKYTVDGGYTDDW